MTSRSSDSEVTQIANEQLRDDVPTENDEEKQMPPKQREGEDDANIVTWEVDDKDNPFNWSSGLKVWITFQLGMLAMAGSLASSIVSPANEIIADYIGVSKEVGVLSVSLYM